YAIGHVVEGSDVAHRIDTAFKDWNIRDTQEQNEIRKSALRDLGQEILEKCATADAENVVPITRGVVRSSGSQEANVVQPRLELEHTPEPIPLAARTSSPESGEQQIRSGEAPQVDRTAAVKPPSSPFVSDDEVFSRFTTLNEGTKTWRERVDALTQFLREDHL